MVELELEAFWSTRTYVTYVAKGGLRSLLRTTDAALLEVASVEDSVQNQYGRPACDPPR